MQNHLSTIFPPLISLQFYKLFRFLVQTVGALNADASLFSVCQVLVSFKKFPGCRVRSLKATLNLITKLQITVECNSPSYNRLIKWNSAVQENSFKAKEKAFSLLRLCTVCYF
jgi:hypothetical protein